MGEDRSFRGQDVIDSVINTGSISNCTIIQLSAATQSSFGFQLYTLDYFKDHKSTEKDFEDWKNGFPFEIEAIKEKKEFRREKVIEEIKTKLESKRNLLIVGESGTSKSTVLKEVICDYLDQDYLVLYNYGTKIGSNDVFIKFIEGLLKGGKKVLVATDDAHNVHTAPIFYIMDQLTRFELNQNLRFVFSARLPDFDHFIDNDLGQICEEDRQSVRKFIGKSKVVDSEFVYQLKGFCLEDIKDFIRMFGDSKSIENIDQTAQRIYQDSKGIAIMVKFYVLGKGLEEDVVDRYYRYLVVDASCKSEKIETMLVCSLLRLSDFEVTDDLLEKMQLYEFALALDHALLYQRSGIWETIHRKWSLELLNFMFDQSKKAKFYEHKKSLWKTFDIVSTLSDERIILALVNGLARNQSALLEDIESKVCSYIAGSACNLSFQAISKLMRVIGLSWEISSEEHNLNHALECYTKAIEADPTNGNYWHSKGNVIGLMGKSDEALECYNKAIEMEPKKGDYWASKGCLLESLGRFEEALECLSTAIRLEPMLNSLYLRTKESLLSRLGRFNELLESYNETIKGPNRVEAEAVFTYVKKGDLLRNLNRFEEALETYMDVSMFFPNVPSVWVDKGNILENLARFEEALESYNKAIDLDSTNALFWSIKGQCLDRMWRFEEAFECFNKAIEFDPAEACYWASKGDILNSLGRFEEALGPYNKAIEINPRESIYWNKKIDELISLERYEEALDSLNNAIELNPMEPEYFAAKGYTLGLLGKFQEALEWCNKAIEKSPTQTTYWGIKGYILGLSGTHDEALWTFNKAIEMNPSDSSIWYNRACLNAIQGNVEQALTDLEKAINLNSDCVVEAFKDKDFESIKDHKRFLALLSI